MGFYVQSSGLGLSAYAKALANISGSPKSEINIINLTSDI
jgi:hypothetical protein